MRDLLEFYRPLLATADLWFEDCRHATGDRLACAAGCSACCRGLFDITLLDALALQEAFSRLPAEKRAAVLGRAAIQLQRVRRVWPGFGHPFLLNEFPREQWEMPEEDAIPCCLLDDQGRCLAYAGRPLTCRLHGLPLIDRSGEIFEEEWCPRNLPGTDLLPLPELRGDFRPLFAAEAALLRRLAVRLGRPGGELDTYIPAALLIDFRALGGSPGGVLPRSGSG